MRLWEGLKWYYELCGGRGVFTVASFRFCGRPRELAVVPLQSIHPVSPANRYVRFLRLQGRSDLQNQILRPPYSGL